MLKYEVIIDNKTIDEIALIVEKAYKEAGKLDELDTLCQWIRDGFPEENNPFIFLKLPHQKRHD